MRKSISTRRSSIPLVVALCLGGPLVALGIVWLLAMPDISTLERSNPKTTALIEARESRSREEGKRINRNWIWVPISRVSPHLRRAVVAAEDASFFTHEGFDWEGIKDAALYDLERGELKRGGSTITQQLAKNLFLSSERSLFRKAHEALITTMLERRLTKQRILELYLNVAEWGRGVYGAEAAARHHFKKPAHDLTADEAAWLAAMLPSPRRYDPIRKTAALMRRQVRILHRMEQPEKRQVRAE